MSPARRASLARVLAGSIALAIVSSSIAVAQDGGPERTLSAGHWFANARVNAAGDIKSEGLKVDWAIDVPADFDFRVDGDGTVRGQWQYDGHATNKLSGRVGGRKVKGLAEFEIDGGGKVRGTAKVLRLSGSGRQKGDMVLTSGGRSTSFDASQKSQIPTLRMPVEATTCDEAYGEWAYTIRQALQRQGFKASATGRWIGFRDAEALRREAQALLGTVQDGKVDRALGTPLLRLAGTMMGRYATFEQQGTDATWQDASDLFADTERVINSLRNLSDCEKQLLGEGLLETYLNGLAFVMQGLIADAAARGVGAEELRRLALGAQRAGVIGPGAPNPTGAAQAEETLIELAERILNDLLDASAASEGRLSERQAEEALARLLGSDDPAEDLPEEVGELIDILNDLLDASAASEGRLSERQAEEAVARLLGSDDPAEDLPEEVGELIDILNDLLDASAASEGRLSERQAEEAVARLLGSDDPAGDDPSGAASGDGPPGSDRAESQSVLTTAAVMNWSLQVGSVTIDAGAALTGD